ncbi:dihydrofolate reductase family protein [Foetidibacter luteolus]|uniref:dihydrofolate reductase family protein n=1 Tax=Foetidibacter luteolus TaxID=2608880 RepID=UPI00129B7A3C|nr:dihydrofolate reductase family protein [Foetidibacter luteolus]
MRKLIFQQWLSLDGYAADADNSVTFIESTTLNKYSDLDQLAWLDSIDTILLGANTYRLFVDFWPTATTNDEVIADKLNSIPKIVFSATMQQAPWGNWPPATVIEGNAVEAVHKLKQQPGKNLVLWGSISLAQDFMKANLIDEYHFRIVPVALGKGRPMFESTGLLNFELFHSRQYESGLMLLQYRQRGGSNS